MENWGLITMPLESALYSPKSHNMHRITVTVAHEIAHHVSFKTISFCNKDSLQLLFYDIPSAVLMSNNR